MYYSIEVGIVFCVIVLSIWLSSIMYSVISKGKSVFLESITNNIGAVLIFSGIYLAMIFAAKVVVVAIFDSLIPYPTMPIYH